MTKTPTQKQLSSLLQHYQAGHLSDAEKLAISITQQFPNHSFSWKVLAAVLKKTGRILEALVANQKAVEITPQDAEAHSNLGNTLKELGRLEEAEASHRKAIVLKPDYAEVYNNLGITLKELGRLEEAETTYRQAIALKLDYADAHNNLGVTLQELGRLEEARESFMQALKINPDFTEAMINLESSTAAAVPTWHLSMMNDKSRNSAYLEALKLAVDDGLFVLEIGTGSGLLSMMAATCGAGEIITCETSSTIANIATKIIHRNGYGKNISVINKKSTELIVGEDLPRKADLV